MQKRGGSLHTPAKNREPNYSKVGSSVLAFGCLKILDMHLKILSVLEHLSSKHPKVGESE